MLDFYGSAPVALFAFAIPVGLVDATWRNGKHSRPNRAAIGLVAAGGLLALASVVGLLLAERAAAGMNRAVILANESRWEDALALAQAAVAADGDMPPYQFALATIARQAGRHDLAAPAYEAAAGADDLPVSWLGVAAERQEVGDSGGARAALAEALRVGRQQTAVLVAAADLYLRLGDQAEAKRCLIEAVLANPTLAADRAWTSEPRLAPLATDVFAAAESRATGAAAIQLALARGQAARAMELVAGLPEEARTQMTLVVRGWQGDEDALQQLLDRAHERPLDLDRVLWAARVAGHQGNSDLAGDLRSWADVVNGLSSQASYELRFAMPGIPPSEVAGLQGRLYGHYTYRRPTPFDQVPAGLLRLELE
jgi:hypothetical protein